jgi:hypothetical protein
VNSINDIKFNFGLQYTEDFKNNLYLTLGLVYDPQSNLNSKQDLIAVTYFPKFDGTDDIKDTVDLRIDEKGTTIFPTGFGGGIALEKPESWMVSGEFYTQKWEDYKSFGISDSLDNSIRFSVGGYFIPANEGILKYWQKIQYRFGFRYSKSYLNLRDNQINEFGLTFGVGLPLRGTGSTVNLAVEFGQRGTMNDGLIKENFISFTLGVAMFERWFIKRKFY